MISKGLLGLAVALSGCRAPAAPSAVPSVPARTSAPGAQPAVPVPADAEVLAGPAQPLPDLPRPLPTRVWKELDAAAFKDPSPASASVLESLWSVIPAPCGTEAIVEAPGLSTTLEDLDGDGTDEIIALVGPLCITSGRSLIAIVAQDRGRPFVRASRVEAIQLPAYLSGPELALWRKVAGPPWSTRTFEPILLRLDDDKLVEVPEPSFPRATVSPGLAKLLRRGRRTPAERSALLAEIAGLAGADACEWLEPGQTPTVRQVSANLDDDPQRELVVLIPDACMAPQSGLGVLALFDPAGGELELADLLFGSFADAPLRSRAESKALLVEEWHWWGSALHASHLVARRITPRGFETRFSIPASFDYAETSLLQALEYRVASSGRGFVVHYSGTAAVLEDEDDDPHEILEFRASVNYRWEGTHYSRTSRSVAADSIDRFAHHGAPLPEDADPWLPDFIPLIESRARKDERTRRFVDALPGR